MITYDSKDREVQADLSSFINDQWLRVYLRDSIILNLRRL